MKKIKCILLCGGDSQRWKSSDGTPKHLVDINGEVLLDITIKQLRSVGIQDIVILGRDDRLKRDGVSYIDLSGANPPENENKLFITEEYWNKKGHTIILYGDVWLSELALSELMLMDDEKIRFVGRNTRSKHTLGPHSEIFGMNFSISSQKKILRTLVAFKNEDISGWVLYHKLTDELNESGSGDVVFSHIDDFTEDFDYYPFYETWVERKNMNIKDRADRKVVSQVSSGKKWKRRTWYFSAVALIFGFTLGTVIF